MAQPCSTHAYATLAEGLSGDGKGCFQLAPGLAIELNNHSIYRIDIYDGI
jgi:hypothetical protein